MLLCMMILFGFGGLSQYTGKGMIVGAITGGVLTRPTFDKMGVVCEQERKTIQSVTYGFLGLLFFFWVGLNTDLEGMIREPTLAILLYLAGTVGKLLGVFLMVPIKKLTRTKKKNQVNQIDNKDEVLTISWIHTRIQCGQGY